MNIRRARSGTRFLWWRLGLFFGAVIVWAVGVVLDLPVMTSIAIGLVMIAIVLGLLARRDPPGEE